MMVILYDFAGQVNSGTWCYSRAFTLHSVQDVGTFTRLKSSLKKGKYVGSSLS